MRTFRSLRHRNYRLYFIGQMVSLIGSWTQTATLYWLAHEQTGEAKWPAFLAAAQLGPTILFGLWGGRLADRVPKRLLILRTQTLFLACAIALLTLHLTGALTIFAMLSVMLVHGFIQAVDVPARLAFIPNLVDRTNVSNAVALNSLLFNTARAVGPLLAALLGPRWSLVFNSMSYLVVILALLAMENPSVAESSEAAKPIGGIRALRRSPGLLTLTLLAGVVAANGWPLLALLPYFAENELGHAEDGYGTLLSSVGIGALIAALTAATIGNDVRPRILLAGGLFIVSLALSGLCLTTTLTVAAGCCVLFGFGIILFFATGQAVVQLNTPDADRGKVMAIWAMMLSAGVPLGNLILGPAADAYGVRTIILVQAAAIAVATVAVMLRRVG